VNGLPSDGASRLGSITRTIQDYRKRKGLFHSKIDIRLGNSAVWT
jgi:hypothetical protein